MSRDQIQLLKQQTTQSVNAVISKQLQAGRSTTLRPPSTFISISAHAWIAFVRSKGFQPDVDAYIIVIADCRPRLDPPVDDAFFGNCVKYFCAKTRASELLGEEGPARACEALQNAINEALEDPLKDCETWLNVFDEIDMSRLVNLTASPRFMVYDITDFGWGRPSRAELVSMNNDGQVVFVGARDGEGVQVSLALHSLHMEAFAKHFSGN